MANIATLQWTRGNGINAQRTNCNATIAAPVFNPDTMMYTCQVTMAGVPEAPSPFPIPAYDEATAIQVAMAFPREFLSRVQAQYAAMGQVQASKLYDLNGLPSLTTTVGTSAPSTTD